jgi:hypothetical protein
MPRVWRPQLVAIVLLLWALYPYNPYGYYVLLRLVCCGVFAFLAYEAKSGDSEGWAWTLGILALLYNPVIRVHLTRELWSVINIATIVVLLWSIFGLPRRSPPSTVRAHQNGATNE